MHTFLTTSKLGNSLNILIILFKQALTYINSSGGDLSMLHLKYIRLSQVWWLITCYPSSWEAEARLTSSRLAWTTSEAHLRETKTIKYVGENLVCHQLGILSSDWPFPKIAWKETSCLLNWLLGLAGDLSLEELKCARVLRETGPGLCTRPLNQSLYFVTLLLFVQTQHLTKLCRLGLKLTVI